MARLLAVDWDRREARFVLATSSGQKVQVLAARSVSLVDVAEGGEEPHPDLGGSLRAALAGHRVGHTKTLVGINRKSVELLHFTVPPADDTELPQLVLNQAIRESPAVTDETAIDFVALDADSSEPRRIAAAAIGAGELERIKSICLVAGIKPARMPLRPFAAASLFARAEFASEPVCLLVNCVADEVDLSVMSRGKMVFSRTAQLPNPKDEERTARQLLVEINRTLAVAAQDRLGSEEIETVYIFGGPEEHDELVRRIGDELLLVAKVVDPFEAVDVSKHHRPEAAGSYASLVGMLLDEVHRQAHAVDLLNPKRPPKPRSRKLFAAVLAVLLAVVALGAWHAKSQDLAELDERIEQLRGEKKKYDDLYKRAAVQRRTVVAIRQWEAVEVNWLDELRDLSLRIPSSRDVLLSRITMSPSRSGGGDVRFSGLVRDPKVVFQMEDNIRDRFHRISSRRQTQRSAVGDYTWSFETTINVKRRPTSDYARYLPGTAPYAGVIRTAAAPTTRRDRPAQQVSQASQP